jgi:heme/copper-type cytochrome/quinol oxidase subunit 4
MGSIKRKELLIGFSVAILATISGFYLYVEYASSYSFKDSLNLIKEHNLLGNVLVLAAIPNLLVFFIFLKKKQDLRAKGVLMACVIIALLILLSQFF